VRIYIYIYIYIRSRDSSIGIAAANGMLGRGGGRDVSLLKSIQTGFGVRPGFYPKGIRGFSPGIMLE
jgi:hypothetical protein